MKIIDKAKCRIRVIGCAAVALMGSVFAMTPMPVYANVPTCICETKCDETHVNGDCKLCYEDYTVCEGKESVKEPEVTVSQDKMGPLTPSGNLTLVDDYGSQKNGGKQFMTVVTKNGNYFYIVIDRDDEGNETVHFLNMVDESDLLSLMDEDQVKKYIAVTNGEEAEDTEPTVAEPEPEPATEESVEVPEKKKKPMNTKAVMAFLMVIGLGSAGGYMYYTSTKNSKKKETGVDPDADYTDEDYLSSLPKENEKELDDSNLTDEE